MTGYTHLYRSALWKSLRKKALQRDNFLCAYCGTVCLTGKPYHPRNAVVDHITPHKGDLELFADLDNLQVLHKACHDGAKQRQEKSGRMQRLDGWSVV